MVQNPPNDRPPSAVVRGFIPAPPGATASPEIPPYAWANFFVYTLDRLHRVSPRVAQATIEEFLEFLAGWGAHVGRGFDAHEWMEQGFQDAARRRSFKGARNRYTTSLRQILFLRNQVTKGNIPATAHQIAAAKQDWRDAAQELSRRLGRRHRLRREVKTVLADLEREWAENVRISNSIPRRKLSYRRALLPFQDALNIIDSPRRGGRPPK